MGDKVYLNVLLNLRRNFSVKLITGFRGTGKLELLQMFADHLKSEGIVDEQIIFINFETTEDYSDFQKLYSIVNKKIEGIDYAYLIFYGIHRVKGWEKAINAFFLGASVEIYIADSHEELLLSKLLPLLPDNFDVIRMYPLSFSAFIQSVSDEIQTFGALAAETSQLLEKYLRFGGFPDIVTSLFDEKIIQKLLKGLLYETLMEDVTIKYSLRNSYLFRVILKFLAMNLGQSVKVKELKDYLESVGLPTTLFTVDNYLRIADESGFFKKIARYDIKNDIIINSGECFYCADNGICSTLLDFDIFDKNDLVKNAVFLELLRQGYEVYCAKIGTMTADFFAVSGEKKLCIQILPMGKKISTGKILRPLKKLPKDIEGVLISENLIKIKDDIKNVTITDFLLNGSYN